MTREFSAEKPVTADQHDSVGETHGENAKHATRDTIVSGIVHHPRVYYRFTYLSIRYIRVLYTSIFIV